MQRVIKKSRALLFMFAFVLVFSPLSALAGTGEDKTINYIALGDSLAAGMLSDGSGSAGYAGYIKSDLESSGYEVKLVNKGVNGATSGAVLAGLPGIPTELANADIITINAGANDVLAGLDPSLLEYLVPGKVAALIKAAEEAAAVAGISSSTALSTIDKAKAPINTAKGSVQDLQDAAIAVKAEIKPYEGSLSPEIKAALDAIFTDIGIAVAGVTEAENEFTKAKEKFITDPGAAAVLFETLAGNLGTAEKKLNSAVTNIGIIEGFIEGAPIPDELKAAVQNVKAKAIGAEEAASNAKGSVGNAKDAVNVAIEAQNTAKSAAEIAKVAVAKATELVQVIEAIPGKIESVGTNMAQMLGAIKTVNPNAKIYVMGYYNALPYLSPEVQHGMTIPLLNDLNAAIKGAADHFEATFIPTFHLFEGKYGNYLPNKTNIHPSEAGYRVLADAFMGEISDAFPSYTEPEEPKEPGELKINLKEKNNVFAGQQLFINDTKVSLLLPTDLPEGTTLTVTETNKDILQKAEDLASFGDALNFEFDFPEGKGKYEGKYELVMGYGKDSPDDVGIHYYNEDKGIWESKEGKVNKESQEISLSVSNFSNYGVFAKAEIKKDPPKTKDPVVDKTPVVPKPPTKGSDNNDGSTVKVKTALGGKKLPTTATNNYNLMLIGTLLLASGIAGLAIRPKKNLIKNEA